MSDVRYAIKRGGKWLQGVEPNQNYCNSEEYRCGDKPATDFKVVAISN